MSSDAQRNIILVGFMGTGKTSTGEAVAVRLKRKFIDMDTMIEEREGMPIPRIFAEKGELYFRRLERDLVTELVTVLDLVIGPGGGIVLNPSNIRDFQSTGVVMCLRAKPETILARVGHDPNRPLLQGDDKLGRIRELMEKRKPLYDAIPIQVDTDGLTPDQVAVKVIDLYRRHQDSH